MGGLGLLHHETYKQKISRYGGQSSVLCVPHNKLNLKGNYPIECVDLTTTISYRLEGQPDVMKEKEARFLYKRDLNTMEYMPVSLLSPNVNYCPR
jgi:hypothetical protein